MVDLWQRLSEPAPWHQAVVAWLITYAVHGSVLLLLAWAVARRLPDALAEGVWKFALLGALLSSLLQVMVVAEPISGHVASLGAVAVEPPRAVAGPIEDALAAPLRWLEPPATELAAPVQTASAVGWPRWLLLSATVAALLSLLHGSVQSVRLRRLLARRTPVRDPALLAHLDELRRAAGVVRVRLSAHPEIATPFAFSVLRPEICLPERALRELAADELDAVLSHELAHIARRDPLWLRIYLLLQSVFCWQPLVRVARRQLQHLAEYRCDAMAARLVGGSPLARCLVEVAGWQAEGRRAPVALPAMAVGSSALRCRVERLLGRAPAERRLPRGLAPLLAVLALGGVVSALPGAAWRTGTAPIAMASPAAVPGDAARDDPRADTPTAASELVLLLRTERRALEVELAALRAELDGIEMDESLRQLVSRLEDRVAALDRLQQLVENELRRGSEPLNPRGERR